MFRTIVTTLAVGALSFGNPVTEVIDQPAPVTTEVSSGAIGSGLPESTPSVPSSPESDVKDRPVPNTPDRTPVVVTVPPSVVLPEPFEYVIPVDCPEEDLCQLDYTEDAEWILYYQGERPFSVVLPVTCPSEDDCTMRYQGDINRWVITESAPH